MSIAGQGVSLHHDAIVIDGLNVSRWSGETFAEMKAAGVTAANCTCCIWEGFEAAMRELSAWKRRFQKHAQTIVQVRTVDDIRRAKREGKVGIILGWQNSSGFGDYLPFVSLFHELGLRVVQLTYNTANSVGSGCYETHDGGLTDFGRELVSELNRLGILIDLSHVADRTAADVLEASTQPVAYTHTLPAAHRAHPRNKRDEALERIAERGGFVGLTFFPAFMRHGTESTVEDYLDAADHVMELIGDEHVGIGTDFTQNQPPGFFEYISRDRGYGRRLVDLGPVVLPEGLQRLAQLPALTSAMKGRGWSEQRIRGFLGLNWLGLLERVWTPA